MLLSQALPGDPERLVHARQAGQLNSWQWAQHQHQHLHTIWQLRGYALKKQRQRLPSLLCSFDLSASCACHSWWHAYTEEDQAAAEVGKTPSEGER